MRDFKVLLSTLVGQKNFGWYSINRFVDGPFEIGERGDVEGRHLQLSAVEVYQFRAFFQFF